MSKSYERHIQGETVFLCSMNEEERAEYFADERVKAKKHTEEINALRKSLGLCSLEEMPGGRMPDGYWASSPRYVRGRGGNSYPAEFIEMYPYSYGRW
jgi:hypothetical protein